MKFLSKICYELGRRTQENPSNLNALILVFEPIGLRFEQIIEYCKGIVQFIVKLPPKAAKKKIFN